MIISRSLTLAAAILTLLACRPALAATVENLYRAQTIVTGTGGQTRMVGLARCLEDVLVKVSGDPALIGDPAVGMMAKDAGSYVESFRYRDRLEGMPLHDDQGTYDRPYDLTVDFEVAKIDAALQKLGRKPWGAERPRAVVFLGVENPKGRFILSRGGEDSPYMVESLDAASVRIGMPIGLPDQAVLAEAPLAVESLATADLAHLDEIARHAGGDFALAGSLSWSDEDHGWIADWRLRHEGREVEWRIRGVNFDEAFRNAMRGAAQVLSGNGLPASR